MIDTRRFVQVLSLGVLQAGAVARRLQGEVRAGHKAGDRSPESAALTAVDLATQDVLLHLLHDAFPEVAVDAEEDTETVNLFPPPAPDRPLVVLDPVDGTLNYTRGSHDYAVMGALIEDGHYRASVIYYPEHQTLCWAVRGEGCFRRTAGRSAQVVRCAAQGTGTLLTPRAPEAWEAPLVNTVGGPLRVSRCSAVDAAAPVLGRADVAVSEKPADRRRAIGFLLTTEAGGAVRYGDRTWRGEDPDQLDVASDQPTVTAANDALADRVVATLRGLDGRSTK